MLQAEPPRDFLGFGNTDTRAGHDREMFVGWARQELKWRRVDWQSVVLTRNAESLADPSGTGAKQALAGNAPPGLHDFQPDQRFKRADEDARAMTMRPAYEVEAPVNPVGSVNISVAGRTEHDLIPPCRSPKGMGSRVFMIIRLGLHDPPADTIHQEDRPYQGLRHLEGRRMKINRG